MPVVNRDRLALCGSTSITALVPASRYVRILSGCPRAGRPANVSRPQPSVLPAVPARLARRVRGQRRIRQIADVRNQRSHDLSPAERRESAIRLRRGRGRRFAPTSTAPWRTAPAARHGRRSGSLFGAPGRGPIRSPAWSRAGRSRVSTLSHASLSRAAAPPGNTASKRLSDSPSPPGSRSAGGVTFRTPLWPGRCGCAPSRCRCRGCLRRCSRPGSPSASP